MTGIQMKTVEPSRSYSEDHKGTLVGEGWWRAEDVLRLSLCKKLRFSQYIVFYTKAPKIKLSNSSQQDYNCPRKRKPHRRMEASEQRLNDLCMEMLEMI